MVKDLDFSEINTPKLGPFGTVNGEFLKILGK